MTLLGIVPGINFFVSGHFLILFIDLTNLPEALCVQKICRGIIHFDPTTRGLWSPIVYANKKSVLQSGHQTSVLSKFYSPFHVTR